MEQDRTVNYKILFKRHDGCKQLKVSCSLHQVDSNLSFVVSVTLTKATNTKERAVNLKYNSTHKFSQRDSSDLLIICCTKLFELPFNSDQTDELTAGRGPRAK